jgi:putative ABC transport system permease protein
MSIVMIFRVALKALARNKLRTTLTMLGMIIGVAAVITMVAIGSGAQLAIESQILNAGTNMITIFPGNSAGGGVNMGFGTSSKLINDDVRALRLDPRIDYVSEGVQNTQQIVSSNQNWRSPIVGVNVDYFQIKSWKPKFGSIFTEDDVRTTAKVCMLGVNVSENLFGEGEDPTDQTVRIGKQLFRVVGVMSPKGASSSGQNQDDQVFAPYTTVQKKLAGNENLNYVLAGTKLSSQIPIASAAITEIIRAQHKLGPGADDDFKIQTQDDMIAVRTSSTQTMTSLLASIAAVSLMVGGIGIMNIMLVSVTERTREIGLRMAIGARSYDVLMQFLVEAVVLSLVGGGLGIVAGYGVADFVKWYQQWPAVVPPNAILMSFGFSGLVGVFFGFYPARKAAALDPIEALRFE